MSESDVSVNVPVNVRVEDVRVLKRGLADVQVKDNKVDVDARGEDALVEGIKNSVVMRQGPVDLNIPGMRHRA